MHYSCIRVDFLNELHQYANKFFANAEYCIDIGMKWSNYVQNQDLA